MKCAHQTCICEETTFEKDGKSYCSEVCANANAMAGHTPGADCPCPHPGCGDRTKPVQG